MSRERAWALLLAAVGSLCGCGEPEGLETLRRSLTQALVSGFADDFESGTLLKTAGPAGQWDSQTSSAGVMVSVTALAAHRGAFGLRLDDTDSSSGQGSGAAADLGVTPSSAEHCVRFWRRVSTSNGQGTIVTLQLDSTVGSSSLELIDDVGTAQWQSGGDIAGGYSMDPAVPAPSPSAWHLVELSLTGAGSASANRVLAVDGTVVSSGMPVDESGLGINQLELGEPYAYDRAFTGTVDFDDFRWGPARPASHFAVSAAATAGTGSCVSITVSLLDTFAQAPAPAPYAFSADVSVSGTGALFSDAACGTATSTLAFASGDMSQTLYFKAAAPGSASLTAAFSDFLPGTTDITVGDASYRWAFTTPARTFLTRTCGGAANVITVQLQGPGGAATPAPDGGVGVALSSSSTGAAAFFTDSACGSPAGGGAFTLAAGSTDLDVYYQDSEVGFPQISLGGSAGFMTPAPQTETVLPAHVPGDQYGASCGCGASADDALGLLLLALALSRCSTGSRA